MTNRRLAFAIGACFLGAIVAGSGCRGESTTTSAPSVGPSYAGEEDVDLRATQRAADAVTRAQQAFKTRSAKGAPYSVLVGSPVDRFTTDGTTYHAVGPAPRTPSMVIDARIPRFADGPVSIETAGVHVDAKVRGLASKPLEWSQKIGVYSDVADGVTAYRRVDEHGVEDLFEVASPRATLSFTYDVTLKGVAGLRLVGGNLELLDASGTPRLAMPAPIVYDAHGVARSGSVRVEGCAYDTNPIGPWNRPVTAPGAGACVVTASVDGAGLDYPVLVDPVWRSTTTDTKQTHAYHHMFVLPAGSDAGKVLLVGGTGTAPRQTELFDVASETWAYSSLLSADFGPGNGAAVFSSGLVVIAGGYTLAGSGSTLKTAQRRDATTAAWTSAAAMKSARGWFAMDTVSIGGVEKILAAGGTASDTATTANKDAELYDPTADTWTLTAAMTNPHLMPAWTKLSTGKVLVAGGYSDGSAFTATGSADIFNPATSTWSSATLATARAAAIAIPLAGGDALVAGGEDSFAATLNTGEIWDGTSFTALTSTMTAARKFPSGTLLSDGRALITGGESNDPSSGLTLTTQTSDLFDPKTDPKTGTFIGTANMGSPRVFHAMVTLPTKGALCTGGVNDASAPSEISLSEIYDTTLGAPCGTGCPTGTFCTEGVCCNMAACPEGQTCAAPGHEGICAKPKGAACTVSSECATGNCVESICCDTPCSGTCLSCTVAGKVGTCTAAAVGTDPGGKCAAGGFGSDPICGPFCDSFGTCSDYAPAGTPCGAAAEAGPDGSGGLFCTRDQCGDFGTCTPSTYNCGLTCTTTVTCNESTKSCTADPSGIKAGYCVIDGACWTYGDIDPTDTTHCRQCNPPVSKTTWFDSCSEVGPDTGVDTGTTDAKTDAPADTKSDTADADAGADTRDATPIDTGTIADSSATDGNINPGDTLPTSSACGCKTPGDGSTSSTQGALLAMAGLAFVVARRRRRL